MFCNGRADTLQAFTIIVLTSVGRLLTRRWSGGVFSHTLEDLTWVTGQFADKLTCGHSVDWLTFRLQGAPKIGTFVFAPYIVIKH